MIDPIVYFDLETSGLEPEHEIIQLGAVAVRNGMIVDAFDEKLQFNVEIASAEALEIAHYSQHSWKNAKAPEVVARLFARFLEPYKCIEKISKKGNIYKVAQLAGYNAAVFDGPKLKALYENLQIFLPADLRILDVMQLAFWHFKTLATDNPPESFKLTSVAEHLGHPFNDAHDALADSIGTYRVADSILSKYPKEIIRG